MRRHLPELALVAVAVAPLLIGLGDQIFEIDPAQYAEVARRIRVNGDLGHLSDNFGAFLNKPPVTMWLAAGAMTVLGETSAAARLPSLLAALVLLAVVTRIGELLWDRRTGLIAAAFLGSSFALVLMVADPKVDMVVTCAMALTVWALLEARRRRWMVWLAWAFAAAGLMSKGPIGLVVPAVAVLPEALRHRWGDREAGSLGSRVSVFSPFRGVLLMAALLAPWYWAVFEEHGWGGPRFLLWEQSFSRVLHQSEYRNATTPGFFLHTGLWAFLPFTPVLLWELGRRALDGVRRRRLPADEQRVVWWWLLLPFVAISLAEFRLPQYLFWLAPPAALLSARAIAPAIEAGRPARVLSWISLILAAASTVAVVLALELAFPPASRAIGALWTGGAVAISAGLAIGVRRWDPALRLTGRFVASTAGLAFFFTGYLHPAIGDFQPDQTWGELARREDPDGRALPFLVVGATNAAAYYARRPATEVGLDDVAALVLRKEVSLAVTDPSYLPHLAELGLEAEIIAERPSFPVSRPSGRFLLAATRPEVVQRRVLIRLRPRER